MTPQPQNLLPNWFSNTIVASWAVKTLAAQCPLPGYIKVASFSFERTVDYTKWFLERPAKDSDPMNAY